MLVLDLRNERALDAEYGPRIAPSAWVMFDNHTFHRLTGTPGQMGQQILECMDEDQYHCYVTVRAWPDGPMVDGLAFHGKPADRRATDRRVIEWVAQMDALFPNLR